MSQDWVKCDKCGESRLVHRCDACGAESMSMVVLIQEPVPREDSSIDRPPERYDACSRECQDKIIADATKATAKVVGEFSCNLPIEMQMWMHKEPSLPSARIAALGGPVRTVRCEDGC